MLLTPSTRLPRRSAGWTTLRIIFDRAAKYTTAEPANWGKRRILTHAETIRAINHKFSIAKLTGMWP